MTITFFPPTNNLPMLAGAYRYETKKGVISLCPPCPFNHFIWEIFSVRGDFFDDVENYISKREAEKRIYSLLEPKFKYGK